MIAKSAQFLSQFWEGALSSQNLWSLIWEEELLVSSVKDVYLVGFLPFWALRFLF